MSFSEMLKMMLNQSDFWKLGHELTGHCTSSSDIVGNRKFRAFFGVSPLVCTKVWNMLRYRIPFGGKPKHLLWTLLFLKCNNIGENNVAIAKVDGKTFRKWVWVFVKMIANLNIVSFVSFNFTQIYIIMFLCYWFRFAGRVGWKVQMLVKAASLRWTVLIFVSVNRHHFRLAGSLTNLNLLDSDMKSQFPSKMGTLFGQMVHFLVEK
jgi:hypothetical protein